MDLRPFTVLLLIATFQQANGAGPDLGYINVALDGVTTQSSTNSSSAHAVDGDNSNGSPCSETLLEEEPWWMVRLAKEERIGSVIINNEFACCQSTWHNISVYVAQNGDRQNSTLCFFLNQLSAGEYVDYGCTNGPLTGDTVVVTADGHASLTICELEIYTAIDGQWNAWSGWSECIGECDTSYAFRTRQCDKPKPLNQGADCMGKNMETASCIRANCSAVDGAWTEWAMGTCSVTCGQGIATRTRYCNNPSPSSGGEECIGERIDSADCAMSPCPILTAMTADPCMRLPCMNDGTCIAIGDQRRRCVCPQGVGGADCQYVVSGQTPVGVWGEWRTSCTVTCGEGTEYSVRQCNNPSIYDDGEAECQGANTRARTCQKTPCIAHVDDGEEDRTVSRILIPLAMIAIVIGPLLALLVFGLYMSRKRFHYPGIRRRSTDYIYQTNLLKTRPSAPASGKNANTMT